MKIILDMTCESVAGNENSSMQLVSIKNKAMILIDGLAYHPSRNREYSHSESETLTMGQLENTITVVNLYLQNQLTDTLICKFK